MKDEALRLALEALELMYACYAHPDWVSHKQQEEKILAQCVATTMTLRQAIKAALEAKDESLVWNGGVPAMLPKQKEGETFIVSYEPNQEAKDEPVGLIESLKDAQPCCGQYETCWRACTPRGKFIGQRDAQRTWVGLTDDDIEQEFGFIDELLRDCVQRTEAKLKEKNT